MTISGMRAFVAISALCAAILAGSISAEETSAELVDKWVAQLGGDDFNLREAASAKLRSLEDSWAPALKQKLQKAGDPEIQQRLGAVLDGWARGSLIWSFEAGYLFQNPSIQDGRVFVMNKDSYLYCLDSSTGNVIWKTSVEDLSHRFIAAADGRVFAIRTRKDGHRDGTVFCMSASSGKIEWIRSGFDSQNFTGPIVAENKLLFGRDRTVFCLDTASGKTLWQTEAPDIVESAPSVAKDRVFYGDLSGIFHCLRLQTGEQDWEFKTEAPVYAGAAISGERLFLGSNDHNVYCLDMDGKLKWKFATGGSVRATPAIANDRVYAGCDDGTFYCLSAADGSEIWHFDTGGDIFASPAVTGKNVYVGSLAGKLTLYCLDTQSGKKLWTFETREAGYPHPVLAGRRLFIGYHSKFYCLRTGEEGPANWPMLCGNAGRTSCNDK